MLLASSNMTVVSRSISRPLPATVGPVRIAIALFPNVEELDFAGPWEVLSYWSRHVAADQIDVFTVSDTTAPVKAAKGLRVLPDKDWSEALSTPLDVLLMPGGHGTRPLVTDATVLDRVRAIAASGTLMTSVCTGSLVYAAAGLLRGRPATTYWDCFDELVALEPTVEPRRDDRFVDDGDVITSAGVSAGIDMALHLVRRLDSTESAKAVRRGIQYDPEPPV